MKIYLYLVNKLLTFSIPKKVSGSFSFDENLEEESKLINIEVRNQEWVLYSTADSKVIVNGGVTDSTSLISNNFYTLSRNNTTYLIWVSDLFDHSFTYYSFSNNLNLLIGNDRSCDVYFNCPYISGICCSIQATAEGLVLVCKNNLGIYVNNISIKQEKYYLHFGDQLNIYGLKIIILNGLLLINNPMDRVVLNAQAANMTPKKIINEDEPQDFEVKDFELYTKEDYFSKAPRIRRLIQTKSINLSPPPKPEGEEKMPLILTIGPMLTMGVMSFVMLINTISKITSGSTTLQQSWPQLASSFAMLLSMLLWPTLTKIFNKKLKNARKKELIEKYTKYLEEKKKELAIEAKLQKDILLENLIPVEQCISIIDTAKINFWDKRIEQNDFLEVRIGRGDELLDVEVNYPEEGFTVDEDELRKEADRMVEDFKYINDVPIGYSLYKNKITGLMGINYKCYGLLNNIILQLITFYSYEDIKLVIFTTEKNEDKWNYLRYLNHSFSNDKSIRYFSANVESAKRIGDFLNAELQNRIQLVANGATLFKPYYVVIVDNYDSIKQLSFMKGITEIDANLGFSMIILEDSLSRLPSKCNNFITMGENTSGLLKNSFEQQEQVQFRDEINYNIDMMSIVKKVSNIPIEFQEGNRNLPDAITFLEMEKVGKVEQLNILNRWDSNDATSSLRAEVGVDEEGNLMYLDLHEKFHGPHGLIAGMTGSGKSEFIITYILSMAINYSPDDVAFILIDYKGGGLAFAFENKVTGISLPHLAGTITNLDKAEMDRTLVSIDSEVKRRQQVFNQARDSLGESTIDIYKYQRYFKEGKLSEPVPHLFIICDEFAELKSQQPDFMDNLISVARIGRSLGVHLILATQKPSGVVNDQIWSNTKFRVCLKVQDASDSKEMLKRPEAASLKQTGRFYLQVGYDEYFALGQSGWCGAKYYPSEKIVKQVDKSINFIDDTGNFIKSIQAGNNIKIEAQGEQLAAIMNSIIEVSNMTHKQAKRLWLNNIEPIILIENLIKKYHVVTTKYDVKAIVGEYDAPEKQEQGLLQYSYKTDGNIAIFGNDETEREGLISSIVYSTCIRHGVDEVNIYMIDYGSESLRMFSEFPQVGGMVFLGEDEQFKNLFKMITNEIKTRKKLLIPYGGSLENYNNKSGSRLPQILFILNNYEAILEVYNDIYIDLSSIGRDCERYGINLMLTCNMPSVLVRRVNQCFENRYTLHLTDPSDYYGAFNMKCRIRPRDIVGRGLANNDGIHEFQTASIVDEEHNVIEYVGLVADKLKEAFSSRAPQIPTLPEKVLMELVLKSLPTLDKVPIGISKNSLKIVKYDFTAFTSTTISSNKLANIHSFMDSLLDILSKINNVVVFFVDLDSSLPSAKEKEKIKYFNSNFSDLFEKMLDFEKNSNTNKEYRIVYIFYGLGKIKNKVDNIKKIEDLFTAIRGSENSNMIFCDGTKNLKSLDLESWYSKNKNNTDGIWIGRGFGEQQNFRISKLTKEMTKEYPNNYGFCLKESSAEVIKLIEFNDILSSEEEEDEE